MKKSAFTLIELLVVISIIAILAGIALPVFSKVLERGKATSDASNLRQLGIGVAAYLNDNDDQMFTLAPVDGAVAVPWPTALHDKYVTNWKTFKSPFDKRPEEKVEPMPVSYAINTNCFGVNASKYVSPSQLLVMAPHLTSGTGEVAFVDEKSNINTRLPMPQGEAKTGTHNNRSQVNCLFADTHCESMNYKKYADSSSEDGMKTWYPTGSSAAPQ
jgi:prepilin-type N-terminal cleavage/methylation domain-containing protein/prepilin-type processing-associated H-X9-DG protein